ncbi:hypothetical protein AVEN_88176-1, partial [Araneus ventricosus]
VVSDVIHLSADPPGVEVTISTCDGSTVISGHFSMLMTVRFSDVVASLVRTSMIMTLEVS